MIKLILFLVFFPLSLLFIPEGRKLILVMIAASFVIGVIAAILGG